MADKSQKTEKQAKMVFRPEPMTVMLKRYDTIERTYPEVYHKPNPKWQPAYKPENIAEVAALAAEWNKSDPFAFKRFSLHMKQGYMDPDKLRKETQQRMLAQKVAKERHAAALAEQEANNG